MNKFVKFFFSILFVSVLLPTPSSAVYFQTSDNISLEKSKTINETVVLAGKNLTIDSTINGDLYCAGQTITINSTVNGDIICAGQTIEINGLVNGALRIAGQNISVDSVVNQNATMAGETVSLNKTSAFKKDLFVGGMVVNLSAPVSRDFTSAGKEINISSLINRNALLAVSRLNVAKTAKITGNLDYYYDINQEGNNFVVDKSQVLGSLNPHEVKYHRPQKPVVTPATTALPKVLSALSLALIGLAIIYFTRPQLLQIINRIKTKPFVSFLTGFAVLILTPILALMLLLTGVGAPLAIIIVLLYLIGLLSAYSYVSILLGQTVLHYVQAGKSQTLPFSLLVGILLTWVIFMIPIAGGLFGFVSICLSLGAFYYSFLPVKSSN